MSHTAADVTELITFISRQQADPATATCYLGETRAGITEELADLDQDWTETVRTVRDAHGNLIGAALGEWDAEVGRAWVYGPWATPDSWDAHADSLLTSVLDQLPEGLTDAEFGYDLRNTRLAALGEERGWHSIGTNHVYVADDAAAVTWPRNVPRIREVTADDLADLTTLHGLEFPGTYATARQLIEDPGKITIVAEDAAGQPIGYASGHIEPDGEGYVDFMAVCPDARGLGDGRRLLAAVCQEVLQRSRVRRVNLTVDTRRRPAIQLYEAFGFSRVASIGGHRSVKPQPTPA